MHLFPFNLSQNLKEIIIQSYNIALLKSVSLKLSKYHIINFNHWYTNYEIKI